MMPRKVKGKWVCPHSANVLAATSLKPLQHYIDKLWNTIVTTIQGQPTLELCRGTEKRILRHVTFIGGNRDWITQGRRRTRKQKLGA